MTQICLVEGIISLKWWFIHYSYGCHIILYSCEASTLAWQEPLPLSLDKNTSSPGAYSHDTLPQGALTGMRLCPTIMGAWVDHHHRKQTWLLVSQQLINWRPVYINHCDL